MHRLFNSDSKRKYYITSILCIITSLCLLLSTATYSWIRRQWSAVLQQNSLAIDSQNALIFKLGESTGTATSFYNIADYLGTDFVLRPVSNITGNSDDFFTLSSSDASDTKIYKHIGDENTTADQWTSLGTQYGYIDVRLWILCSEDSEQQTGSTNQHYLYLSTASTISCITENSNAAKAIRVGISIGGSNYIFTTDGTTCVGINNITTTTNIGKTWLVNGLEFQQYDDKSYTDPTARVDTNSNELIRTYYTTDVTQLSAYDGGIRTAGNMTYFDPDKCLASINSNNNTLVTIKVWLEGEDPECTSAIASNEIDILIKIESIAEGDGVAIDTQ